MKKTKFVIFSIIFLLLLNLVNAVNINPDKLYFNEVLSGGYAEKTVAITTDSDEALFITSSVGGKIKGWISLSPDTSLKVSKKLPLELKVAVKPPKNTANGVYSGYITLNILNKKAPEISDRETFFLLETIVEVTDKEIKKLAVKDIFVGNTEQNLPIDFFITIFNEGNIEIKPIVKLNSGNKSYDDKIILLPFEEKEAIVSLDSNELELGQHSADISIFLDDLLIKREILAFNIFKKDSLIRKGILLDIANKERVHINDGVLVDSYFKNTGEISVYAQFKGKVYFNNSLIEEIESGQVYTPVGKTTILSSYFTPHETGRYSIIGVVFYSNTITDEKESFVDVLSESESLEVVPLGINYAAIVFLILVLLIVTNIYLKRKISIQKNRHEEDLISIKNRSSKKT